MLIHYVTFLFPGSFMPEERSEKIDSRSSKFEVPKNCFAYYFWDREEVYKEDTTETLFGNEKNRSGRFYFGKAMSVEDVKREVPDSSILVSNMENNGWLTIVKTRRGNFQPLLENDVIVMEKDKVAELMKPRYRVIAGWPEMEDDEDCQVGKILTDIDSSNLLNTDYLDKYPHLFKKLEWWEEREVSEMPEYVKTPDKKIFKVHHWDATTSLEWIEEECFDIYCDRCQPATKEEYLQYITNR